MPERPQVHVEDIQDVHLVLKLQKTSNPMVYCCYQTGAGRPVSRKADGMKVPFLSLVERAVVLIH